MKDDLFAQVVKILLTKIMRNWMRDAASDLEILILSIMEELGLKIVTMNHAPFTAVLFTEKP